MQLSAQVLDVVVDQLLIRLSHDQHPDTRIVEAQPLGLVPHHPALASASRAAVGHVLVMVCEEELLLFVGCTKYKLTHSIPADRPAA